MNKEELKLKLIDMFSKTYEETVIDKTFIVNYKTKFWDAFIGNVEKSVKSKSVFFHIDQWFVSPYDFISQNASVDTERPRIFAAMRPLIKEWLDNAGVKYHVDNDFKGDERYKILMTDLKEFSNFYALGALK